MTAFASILTPFDRTPPIELGNAWRKRILPIGEISYQGRTLKFTRPYLQGLVSAWQDRAYDAVPLQLADAQNTHTNDPERTRGWITDMTLGDDGLYITAEVSPRGQHLLAENPLLGVSARIVEQYQRADGKFYPAAVQHVLATLDPRIPALGTWQPVEMANGGDSAVTIDLSNLSFAGEPAYAPAASTGGLSGAELGDLLEAMAEADAELDGSDELSDAELEAMMQAAESGRDWHDAAGQFDAAFSQRLAADARREQARAEFEQLDLIRPARRSEDKLERIMARASAGLYDGQQADFTAEAASVEIMLANGGSGPCGALDEFGRCAERYHQLGCMHDQSVDWVFSNPPASTGQAALANLADELALDLSARSVWGDPDDLDEPWHEVPARTVELAHQLAHDWGLDATAPGGIETGTGFTDLLRPPGAPVSIEDELLAGMGYELPQQPRPAYPGISELRARMGI